MVYTHPAENVIKAQMNISSFKETPMSLDKLHKFANVT